MEEKVSIIVVFHNLMEITLQCFESIYQHTNPFEVIAIDNGSSKDYQKELERYPSLKMMKNKINLGYAKAFNQGLKRAQGELYLILNNDCIVTPNWLTNMVRCIRDDERNGIVGPLTNRIGNPKQRITVPPFKDYEDLMAFARDFNRPDPRKWFSFNHALAGFCMLIKPEVIKKVGYFDEKYGIGLCEDYDFVRKAIKAGFKVKCAGDTFIFHYYSRTFEYLKIDRKSLLQKNLRKYRKKWSQI